MPNFRASKYQKAIWKWMQNWSASTMGLEAGDPVFAKEQKRHLRVEAVAGSGKTTTIVEAAKFIPTQERGIFLAFNKHIAEELGRRLPMHVRASTTHSLAYRAYLASEGAYRGKPEGLKTSKILREMQTTFLDRQIFPQVRKMVSQAKSLGIVPVGMKGVVGLTPDSAETWADIFERFDITFEDDEQQEAAISMARYVLRDGINRAHNGKDSVGIDFDDMLYLPIVMRLQFPKFKWVIIDEAQDINLVQREMVKRIVEPGTGHVIAVGDSRQAIYGFRGADSQSMENIRKDMNADTLPLSICYRCAKNIVREAKRIVPQIEYADSADEGFVEHGLPLGTRLAAYFTPDVSVLCPFNAPLISFAFKLLKEKIAVRVLGKEIGEGVAKQLRKLGAFNVGQAREMVKDWYEEQRRKIDQDDEDKLAALQDKYEVLMVFLDEEPDNESIENVALRVEAMFAEKPEGGILTLSTIHKAKGLEWDHVVLIDSDRLLNTMRKRKDKLVPMQPWEIEQRMNLLYVAITRAKQKLVYVTSTELRELQ